MNMRRRKTALFAVFFLCAAGLGQKIRSAGGDDPITPIKSADKQIAANKQRLKSI